MSPPKQRVLANGHPELAQMPGETRGHPREPPSAAPGTTCTAGKCCNYFLAKDASPSRSLWGLWKPFSYQTKWKCHWLSPCPIINVLSPCTFALWFLTRGTRKQSFRVKTQSSLFGLSRKSSDHSRKREPPPPSCLVRLMELGSWSHHPWVLVPHCWLKFWAKWKKPKSLATAVNDWGDLGITLGIKWRGDCAGRMARWRMYNLGMIKLTLKPGQDGEG